MTSKQRKTMEMIFAVIAIASLIISSAASLLTLLT